MRTSTFDMYYDPRHFNPLQLQPRCAIEFCFQGLARWFAEYVTTFPAMIHDRRVGVVAIALDVDYLAPFSFFDGDRFTLTARCRLLRAGSMLETTTYRAVPLAEGVHHVTVYRHLCEVADQWCSSELPGYFGLCAACTSEFPVRFFCWMRPASKPSPIRAATASALSTRSRHRAAPLTRRASRC